MATLGGCSGCLQLRSKGSVTVVSTRTKGRGSVFIRCKSGAVLAVKKPTGSIKQRCCS